LPSPTHNHQQATTIGHHRRKKVVKIKQATCSRKSCVIVYNSDVLKVKGKSREELGIRSK